MSSMLTETKPKDTGSDKDDDDLVHTYCSCDPDHAVCGTYLEPSTREVLNMKDIDPSRLCVVCIDMIVPKYSRCPKCKRQFI